MPPPPVSPHASIACPILKVWARPFALPVQHRLGNRSIRVLGIEIQKEFSAIRYILGVIPHRFTLVAPFHKVLESPSPTPNIEDAFNLCLLVCLTVAVV